MTPLYRRVLLKLSGEALMGDGESAISPDVLNRLAKEIAQVHQMGVQIAVVVGAGNFFRGVELSELGMDRVTGDQIGMLATIMNALALRDAFEQAGMPTRILSPVAAGALCDLFERRKAIRQLEKNRVLIFAGGTGNPLCTTDSAASLRGIEINADVILKATNVDGVYSSDPRKDKNATLYQHLSYQEALEKELAIMDLAAFCQCRDYDMTLRVFNITKHNNFLAVVTGDSVGTLVDNHASKEKK